MSVQEKQTSILVITVRVRFLLLTTEKWNTSCHTSKQRYHSRQQLQPSCGEPVSPEGAQGGVYLLFSSHQTVATTSDKPWGTLEVKTGYWPQIAEMYIKGIISVSLDFGNFPTQKVLNSFAWDIWFSLTHKKILLSFWPPVLCCKTSL